MDRKRKANTLGDNVNSGDSAAAAAAGSGGDGDSVRIPDLLFPHVLSYCNTDTLKRSCACVSRSWYTMVTNIVDLKLWNDASERLLTHQTGKCQDMCCYIKCSHLMHHLIDNTLPFPL